MIRPATGYKGQLLALITLSLGLYPACGDDEGALGSNGGGGSESRAGASNGGRGGLGAGGLSGAGSLAGAQNEAGESGAGEGGASAGQGGASAGDSGNSAGQGGLSAGDAGAGGAPEPCAGELANGACRPAFARAQSAKQTAGKAAVSDVVKLPADSHAGNLLVLSVGVVWSGVSTTITVPPGFTLVERRDNSVGTAHESAALYLAEGAASLPAATGVTVSLGEADARLYLGLAEYSGFRASGVLDQVASSSGSGSPSAGPTAQTTADDELWFMLVISRGGGGHTNPSNGFAFLQTVATGAGTFSFSDQLVATRGMASSGVTGSGDYAAILATLRR